MEVRPLKNDEVEELLGLWKEFMNDPSAIDEPIPPHDENVKRKRDFVMKLMSESLGQILVASDGNELIGYAMFYNEVNSPFEKAHRTSEVTDLYVKPNHRRRGVGEQLLQRARWQLRSRSETDPTSSGIYD